MSRFVRWFMLAVLVAATRVPVSAQNKVLLVYKAKPGQVVRYTSEGSLDMEAAGQKVKLDLKEVEKMTFQSVAANGDITRDSETESSEISVNGNKMPSQDDQKDKSTIVVRPNGTLVSYKSDRAEKDEAKISIRLFAATNPVFSDKPVGVGDKWTSEVKPDSDLGTRRGKADYEVLAFDKSKGIDCVKIKMAYKESEGNTPLGVTGTLWIEKSSGDTVVGEIEIENLPFGGPGATASGSMRQVRSSGSPLGDAGGATGDTKPEPKKEKNIDETVKDYEKIPGLFALYRKKESGRDTIYLEIKEDQLDRLIFFQATAGTGTSNQSQVVAGDPINDLLFRFHKTGDDHLYLVTPNNGFRADDKNPISRAVRRSYADAYLESYKIEAKQADRKSLLINVSDLFRGDIAEISQRFSGGGTGALASLLGGGGAYSMDREKTTIQTIKNFPENLVVETEYHFQRGAARAISLGGDVLADPRSIPLRVVYNVFMLPLDGYRPRLADPRVGYFVTEYEDYDHLTADESMVRYILRWQLEKADPKAAMSPPKKPIVFWLDNAIPLEYRDAVRNGILFWNKAFERIGIKGAIEVKQQPDNADWDHADMRYNTIRWVTSPQSGYMVALFRANPITGQILNASITTDANFVRYTELERKRIVAPSTYFDALENVRTGIDPRRCDIAEEAMNQAWFGDLALRMAAPVVPPIDSKRYMNEMLSSVVCHEMGHILGLRHNFIASTSATLDQLKSAAYVNSHGVTASVMDYTPFNISALKQKETPYWSQTVGDYDLWAIEYGYRPFDGAATPEGELYNLKQIASRCNLPGHGYQTDENADSFDPDVTRFDISANPLAGWRREMEVSRYLLLNLMQRVPKPGESYVKFTQNFSMLVNMIARGAAQSSRYIGGLHMHRNFRGDAYEKPTLSPVPAEKQREALRLINAYVFSENAFTMPRSYMTHLEADPFPDGLSSILGGLGQDYPVRDTIASIQTAALRRLLNPSVLNRIANNEFKIGDPTKEFTLPELFSSLDSTLWTELPARRNINTLRRQLQRTYLDSLIGMVVDPGAGGPEDAKMLAWDQLRTLRARIRSARQGGRYDTYTRVHLDEALARIERALDARQMVGAPSGGSSMSLLQQLLGGGDHAGAVAR